MTQQSRPKFARSLRLGLLIAAVIGVVTGILAWHQVQTERAVDIEDVTRRAHALAEQLANPVLDSLTLPNAQARAALAPHLEGYRRLLGYAVYRTDGQLVAAGKSVSDFTEKLEPAAREAARTHADFV